MVKTTPAPSITQNDLGQKLYQSSCGSCHGYSSARNPGVPSLAQLNEIVKPTATGYVEETLQNGKGQMPRFGMLSEDEKKALAAFLHDVGREKILQQGDLELSFSEVIPMSLLGTMSSGIQKDFLLMLHPGVFLVPSIWIKGH